MWYLGSSLWFILVSHQPAQLGLVEQSSFVWVTWVENKNSSYNNKQSRRLEHQYKCIGTKINFESFWSAVIAEPKLPKMQRKRKRDIETNNGKFLEYFSSIFNYVGHNSSAPQKDKKGGKTAPCKMMLSCISVFHCDIKTLIYFHSQDALLIFLACQQLCRH